MCKISDVLLTKVGASVKNWDGIFTQKSGSTGKEEEGDPGSGGKDFPSHSADVVCRSLFVMSLCLFTHFRGNV